MKFVKAIATALVLGALTAPAMAEDAAPPAEHPWGTFSANIDFTNDYVFRGFSQTLEHPAIQGGLDWDSGHGFYLGTWGSNVEFTRASGEGSMEWDVYGGYKGTIDKFSYDLGVIGYLYPGTNNKLLHYNYVEGKIALGYDFGFAQLAASFFYSPNTFGGLDDTYYYNGAITVPLIDKLSASAAIGRLDYKNSALTDVTDYNVGLTYAFDWFSLDVRWYDTNLNKSACTVVDGAKTFHPCDSRFVAMVKHTF